MTTATARQKQKTTPRASLLCERCGGVMAPMLEGPRIIVCEQWHFRVLTVEEAEALTCALPAELVEADSDSIAPDWSEIRW